MRAGCVSDIAGYRGEQFVSYLACGEQRANNLNLYPFPPRVAPTQPQERQEIVTGKHSLDLQTLMGDSHFSSSKLNNQFDLVIDEKG